MISQSLPTSYASSNFLLSMCHLLGVVGSAWDRKMGLPKPSWELREEGRGAAWCRVEDLWGPKRSVKAPETRGRWAWRRRRTLPDVGGQVVKAGGTAYRSHRAWLAGKGHVREFGLDA